MLTASTTLSTSGVEAEPLVEKDNMDTRGSAMPTTLRAFSTCGFCDISQLFASWVRQYAAVGEYEHTSSPYSFLLVNMNMEEDTVLRPGLVTYNL